MNQLTPLQQFIQLIEKPSVNSFRLNPYPGQNYDCACGEQHAATDLGSILFMGHWKIVMTCPNNERYLSLQKVSMISALGYCSLEHLASAVVELDADAQILSDLLGSLV